MKSHVNWRKSALAAALLLATGHYALAMDAAEAKQKFCDKYGDLCSYVDAAQETGIEGIYEMTELEGAVLYYLPASGHVIFGKIYDRDGRNIAEVSKKKRQLARMQVYVNRRDRAITVGSGPIEVIEVTNPDCLYCRELSKHLDQRKDVTRRIFLSGDEETIPKLKYIAAAADQGKALREVMEGRFDAEQDLSREKLDDKGLVELHRKLADEADIASTPLLIINGTLVVGADLEAVDRLIDKAKENK